MPAVMEQVNRMSVEEKLRLIAYIANSMSVTAVAPVTSEMQEPVARERKKPRISDFIGYGAKFHELRSTEEWMKELREGEDE